jgi:hypothetical protein
MVTGNASVSAPVIADGLAAPSEVDSAPAGPVVQAAREVDAATTIAARRVRRAVTMLLGSGGELGKAHLS